MTKRLYKSKTDRKLCGVCGGIAEYFAIDPTIVRLAFALFAFLGGGVLAYIVCAIIIPEEPGYIDAD